MSAAILPALPVADSLRYKRFTRTEIEHMLDLGLFDGQRFELIDGELIDKMGQNPPHARAIRKVFACLLGLFPPATILIQAPVETSGRDRDWSVPEPDVAVLRDEADIGMRHPRADELLLAVEVADASLRQDSIRKRDLYARAGVPEYWVLDLRSRRLIVHRNPDNGTYRETLILSETDLVSPAGRPETIAVGELLA